MVPVGIRYEDFENILIMRSFTSREKPISRTLDSKTNASNIQKSAMSVMQLYKWRLTERGWEPLDNDNKKGPFTLKATDKRQNIGKIYDSDTGKWEATPVETKAPLGKGDFYLTGITESAGDSPDADAGLIARFEDAVKLGEMTWYSFGGDTHHTIVDPRGGRDFKAHFYDGKNIKLYIDQSRGAKSELRAIYALQDDHTLKFIGFGKH